MCVGESAKANPQGCRSGPIKSQRLSPQKPPLLLLEDQNSTHRCQVPSGWTGPSHWLVVMGPPYRQPALADGAAANSPPASSAAPRMATKATIHAIFVAVLWVWVMLFAEVFMALIVHPAMVVALAVMSLSGYNCALYPTETLAGTRSSQPASE
jgi:hypothetical protein